MRKLFVSHGYNHVNQYKKNEIIQLLEKHSCTSRCPQNISVFQCISESNTKPTISAPFPPRSLEPDLVHKIISDWTDEFHSTKIVEIGCAVCGQLKLCTNMTTLKSLKNHLHVLEKTGVTRKQRKSASDPITEIEGPVIDHSCAHVCEPCRKSLRNGQVPRISLANGLWIGNVPPELQCLNFTERLLIQKVRTNCCFVKVSSGMRKMISHVIAFETPVAKVYE
ncbi:hypothetical protein K435DRAFT_685277, partial [Dendrothele bispora CBS 962.96]